MGGFLPWDKCRTVKTVLFSVGLLTVNHRVLNKCPNVRGVCNDLETNEWYFEKEEGLLFSTHTVSS